MFFSYNSPFGTFVIRPMNNKRFGVTFDNRPLGSFASPQDAANHLCKILDALSRDANILNRKLRKGRAH